MAEAIRGRLANLFDEPEGYPTNLVWLAFGLLFFAIYGFFGVLDDAGSPSAVVIGVAFVAIGLAESLPASRTRLAGAIRVASLVLLVALVLVGLLAPDLLTP